KGGRLLLTFNEEDKLERLRLATNNQLSIEHFDPKADFPNKPPVTFGTGSRKPSWQSRPLDTKPNLRISDLAGQWTVLFFNGSTHVYTFGQDGRMHGLADNDVQL